MSGAGAIRCEASRDSAHHRKRDQTCQKSYKDYQREHSRDGEQILDHDFLGETFGCLDCDCAGDCGLADDEHSERKVSQPQSREKVQRDLIDRENIRRGGGREEAETGKARGCFVRTVPTNIRNGRKQGNVGTTP